jgi:AcrR family transcriptional regulator
VINPVAEEQTSTGRATYRSALRAAQAAQTRERVLDAAGDLFARSGYLRTTMAQIADAAGVSVETVYAQGSKQALLLASVDRALAGDSEDVPLFERAPVSEALDRTSAPAVIHGFAVFLTDIAFRAAGLLVAFEDAAAADAATLELWTEAEQHRRQDYLRLVETVAALAPLREGLDLERATDGLWRTVSPRLAHHLIDLGWTRDQVADWAAAIGTSLLLDPQHRRPA